MVDFVKLSAPFPPGKVHWRVGSTTQDKKKGMALAYIDARDVMERLDEACGPDGWQCRYPHANSKTCCEVGIRTERTDKDGDVFYSWIWKADGAGDTDFEGDKGAFSDAFKRAAVRWGIGRYLYGLGAEWVEIEQKGRSYVIKPSAITRLNKSLVPQQKWHGPLNKTTLGARMRDFSANLNECLDSTQLVALLVSRKAEHEQCMVDLPDWWYGDDNQGGAAKAIEDRRKFIEDTERFSGAAE